jgi:hypothetical protein
MLPADLFCIRHGRYDSVRSSYRILSFLRPPYSDSEWYVIGALPITAIHGQVFTFGRDLPSAGRSLDMTLGFQIGQYKPPYVLSLGWGQIHQIKVLYLAVLFALVLR